MKAGMVVVLAAVLGGCGTVPVEGAPKQVTADAARISYTVNAAFAGITWKVEVDSATGAYRTTCTSVRNFACGSAYPVRSGTVARTQLTQLFSDASRSDFRGLRAEYDMSGTFVDGPAYSISVVAGGSTKDVRWSDAERPLPAALARVVDALKAATGTQLE